MRRRPTTRLSRRFRSKQSARLAGGLLLVAALTGTLLLLTAPRGLEDAQQQAAREATQRHVRASATAQQYDVVDTRCTDSARTFLRIEETSIFICAVRRVDGDCDWFRLEAAPGGPRIRLEAREAGCVLPK